VPIFAKVLSPLILIVLVIGPARADDSLVPSPACIADLIANDKPVPVDDCLVDLASLETRSHTHELGDVFHVATIESSETDTLAVSYSEDAYTDLPNGLRLWPVSTELNGGGTGWFSATKILMRTPEDAVEIVVNLPFGDRCNDGYAKWIKFDFPYAYTAVRATPFRLLNPLDEQDWRMLSLQAMVLGKDEDKSYLLGEATVPLYQDWLPYDDINNAAMGCMGQIVQVQNLLGEEVENGKPYRVDAIIVDVSWADELKSSDKKAERCFGQALSKGAPAGTVLESEDQDLLLVNIDQWIAFRDTVASYCAE